eukprot:RCo015516
MLSLLVSRPFSTVNSSARMVTRAGISNFLNFPPLREVWMSPITSFTTAGSLTLTEDTPRFFLRASKLGTTSMVLYGWFTPYSRAWATKRPFSTDISIGTGATHLPFSSLYSSFTRPVILSTPSGLITPWSPVRKYRLPSRSKMVSAVASGRLWYPFIMLSPAATISPSSPGFRKSPSGPMMARVTPGKARIPPCRWAVGPNPVTAIVGEVSVSPYPSTIDTLQLLKKVRTSSWSAAPPETANWILPPRVSRIFENTSLSKRSNLAWVSFEQVGFFDSGGARSSSSRRCLATFIAVLKIRRLAALAWAWLS